MLLLISISSHPRSIKSVGAVAALCADRIVWREDGVATYQELDKSG
jgi:hypothetical protein